jgi:branched-chain amino acid transport system substrate-binding protein
VYDNFAAAFLRAEPKGDVIRIGLFEPLSGKDKEFGLLERTGVELAHKLYPEVLGRPIELVVADNRSDLNEARVAAEILADKDVALVLGSYRSTLSLAGGEIFAANRIPAISVTNSNPLVTNTNSYYFRVRYVESFQGVAVAKYATENLGVSRAAVMRETDNDFSAAVCQSFSDKLIALTENPDAVVYTANYDLNADDYTAELTAIRDSGARVVFAPTAVETALRIVEQAALLRLDAIFVGTDLWETDALLQTTDSALLEKMAFSSDYGQDAEETALAKEFSQAFQDIFGKNAVPDHAVALGFDAYMLARDAIERAGIADDREAIVSALAETRSFPGVSGNISFDENGDLIKSVSIMTVRNGEFVKIYTAEPNWELASQAEAQADGE